MKEIRTILLATDFGALSETAAQYAVDLAHTLRAELHVLHVVDSALGAGPTMPVAPGEVTAIQAEWRKEAESQFAQMFSEQQKRGVKVVFATDAANAGNPHAKVILAHADRVAADLIVMGGHGRGPVAQLFTGSMGQQVLRDAQCPVLLCGPGIAADAST